MYLKQTKGRVKHRTPGLLTTQEISRNRAIHEALREELAAELQQNGSLGQEGRTISNSHPRLKLRLARG